MYRYVTLYGNITKKQVTYKSQFWKVFTRLARTDIPSFSTCSVTTTLPYPSQQSQIMAEQLDLVAGYACACKYYEVYNMLL